MAEKQNLQDLRIYVQEISTIYSGIGEKIESLILILNETGETDDYLVPMLAKKIIQFLETILVFVKNEKKIAKNIKKKEDENYWTDEKRKKFLALVKKETNKIKELEKYIKMEKEKPRHQLVIQINGLNTEIKSILAGEKALLNQ